MLTPEREDRRPKLTPFARGGADTARPCWRMVGRGMKGVDTIARVRREFFVRGRTIKQISRDLHIARNTVRKILRSEATSFDYERGFNRSRRSGPGATSSTVCWRPMRRGRRGTG